MEKSIELRLTPSRILKNKNKISISTGERITRKNTICSTPNNINNNNNRKKIQDSASEKQSFKTLIEIVDHQNNKTTKNRAARRISFDHHNSDEISNDKIIKIINTTQSSSSSTTTTTTTTTPKTLINNNNDRQEFDSIKLLQTLLLNEEFKEYSKNIEKQLECLNETFRIINNPLKSKIILNYLLQKCKDFFHNNDLLIPYDNFYPLFTFDINMEPYFEFFMLNQHSSLNKIKRLHCTNDECLEKSRIIYALVYQHWKNITK